jgi:hypothetical protein
MKRKTVISEEDLIDFFQTAKRQLGEDRQKLIQSFEDLKALTNDNRTYAMNGLTLAKFAELMSKQTGQLIDLLKVVYDKDEQKEGELVLSDEEKQDLYENIEKPRKK